MRKLLIALAIILPILLKINTVEIDEGAAIEKSGTATTLDQPVAQMKYEDLRSEKTVRSPIENISADAAQDMNYIHGVLIKYFEAINDNNIDQLKSIVEGQQDAEYFEGRYDHYLTRADYTIQSVFQKENLLICNIIVSNEQTGEIMYSQDELFEFREVLIINKAFDTIKLNGNIGTQEIDLEPIQLEDYNIKFLQLTTYVDFKQLSIEVKNKTDESIYANSILRLQGVVDGASANFHMDEIKSPVELDSSMAATLYFKLPVHVSVGDLEKLVVEVNKYGKFSINVN